MTRIEFQPTNLNITGEGAVDASQESQKGAEAFRALLALQQARYWESASETNGAGIWQGDSLFSSPSTDDMASWLISALLIETQAKLSSATERTGSGAASVGGLANTQAAQRAGIAAYRSQTAEQFQALKPAFLKAEQQTGVPWQVQAAQWALETGWGTQTPKDLVTGQESHNLFGVKGVGPAGSVTAATMEYEGGRMVSTTAQFKAYRSEAESILEHALLLTGPRYAAALACGKDLKAWTEQLGKSGYATDPEYGEKLWRIITENGWNC